MTVYHYNAKGPDEGPDVEDPDAHEAALLSKARDRPWVLALTTSSVASFVALLVCLFTPDWVAFSDSDYHNSYDYVLDRYIPTEYWCHASLLERHCDVGSNQPGGEAYAMLGLGATASLLLVLNVVILAWLGLQTPTPRQRASVMLGGTASAFFAWLFVFAGLVVYTFEACHLDQLSFGPSFGFAWAVCACLAFICAAWIKMAHQAQVDCRRCPHEDRMHEQIPDSDLELAAPATCMETTEMIQPMAQKLGASVPRIPPATIQLGRIRRLGDAKR